MTRPMTVFRRTTCPLCEELLAQLEAYPLTLRKVEIDGDRDLEDAYGMRVPVLVDEATGQELAEGRLEPAGRERLELLLEART